MHQSLIRRQQGRPESSPGIGFCFLAKAHTIHYLGLHQAKTKISDKLVIDSIQRRSLPAVYLIPKEVNRLYRGFTLFHNNIPHQLREDQIAFHNYTVSSDRGEDMVHTRQCLQYARCIYGAGKIKENHVNRYRCRCYQIIGGIQYTFSFVGYYRISFLLMAVNCLYAIFLKISFSMTISRSLLRIFMRLCCGKSAS